jgi:hypothetical protein
MASEIKDDMCFNMAVRAIGRNRFCGRRRRYLVHLSDLRGGIGTDRQRYLLLNPSFSWAGIMKGWAHQHRTDFQTARKVAGTIDHPEQRL